jgi:hypothetical protein
MRDAAGIVQIKKWAILYADAAVGYRTAEDARERA